MNIIIIKGILYRLGQQEHLRAQRNHPQTPSFLEGFCLRYRFESALLTAHVSLLHIRLSQVHNLCEFERMSAVEREGVDCYFSLLDPSSLPCNPGWPLRNLLYREPPQHQQAPSRV